MEWLVWMVAVAILGLAAVAASGRLGEFPGSDCLLNLVERRFQLIRVHVELTYHTGQNDGRCGKCGRLLLATDRSIIGPETTSCHSRGDCRWIVSAV